MALEIKIYDTTYTLHNEDKKCLFCNHCDKQDEFKNDVQNGFAWGYPDFHPCKGCIDFSKWAPTQRHLFQIIQFLQYNVDRVKKVKTVYTGGDCII